MTKADYKNRCPKLVGVMMAKNEEKRIIDDTMKSISPYCSDFVLYDTGSTDNTIDVIRDFCSEHKIKFHLKQGDFVNFRDSRNTMLDYADEIFKGKDKYYLLLDAHDELKNGEALVNFINSYTGDCAGFYLMQQWLSHNTTDTYFNVRLIKAHNNWRYKGVVHEFITDMTKEDGKSVSMRLDKIILYQDRTVDDDKSVKRFTRDKAMLYAEYIKNPRDPRTLFYLGQTCTCLGHADESYKYYMLRIKETGFLEEIYQCYVRLGDIAILLGHDWEESLLWYLKAFQHSQRAEPLLRIAEYYSKYNMNGVEKPEWHTCYMYAYNACQLVFPVHQILFVSREDYVYKRWHMLSVSAYHVGKYVEGKEACLRALEAKNLDIDREQLKLYMEKESEAIDKGSVSCPGQYSVTCCGTEMRADGEMEVNHSRKEILSSIINKLRPEMDGSSNTKNKLLAINGLV